MNRPCLLHEIPADETRAAGAERCAPAAEEQTHAEAVAAARALSLADAVMAAALPTERSAAGFVEAASAGNSAEATAHPARPEAHSGAGFPAEERVDNSDATTEPHVFPEVHSGAGSPEAEPVGNSDVTIPAGCAECCSPAVHTAHSSVAAQEDYSSAAGLVHDPGLPMADAAHCACHDPASRDGCCPAAAGLPREYSAGSSDNLSPVRAARFLPAAATVRFAVLKAAEHSLSAGFPDYYSPAHWDARHTVAACHHGARRLDFRPAVRRSAPDRF